MEAIFSCFIFVLLGLCLASSSRISRPFSLVDNEVAVSQKLNDDNNEVSMEAMIMKKKIGSRPPSCEEKCYGCMPCVAIQVPTNKEKHVRDVGLLYTNYEPEGWKCKCGPTLYTP